MILEEKNYKAYSYGGMNLIPNNQIFTLKTAVTLVDYDWNGYLPHTKAYYFGDNSTTRQLSINISSSGHHIFSFFLRMEDNSEPMIYPLNPIDFGFDFINSASINTSKKTYIGNNIWRLSIEKLNNPFTAVRIFKSQINTPKPFYVYGYQVEPGNKATKYTPTYGTAIATSKLIPLHIKSLDHIYT